MTVQVLGVGIENATMDEAIDLVRGWCRESGRTRAVYFANAHTLNLASVDPAYRDALNRADVVFGDGSGVRWAARRTGIEMRDNVNGTDFTPAFLERTAGTVFLLGATPEVNAALADRIPREYPGYRVVGARDGYYAPDEEEDVVAEIRRARPNLLLVAFGNPRQEAFIDRYRDRLGAGVAMGVGGLFDYMVGKNPRAPLVMRRLGLEWLYVTFTQPHKMTRYLLGNPLFVVRVLGTLLIGDWTGLLP